LKSAYRLAVDLYELGEHQQARSLDEDTLTRYRRTLGPDHPDTLKSADNLAIDLRALGKHEQARALIEDIFIRRRRMLGDDHPDTLRIAATLAENPSGVRRDPVADPALTVGTQATRCRKL
jgi:hypothetical protein